MDHLEKATEQIEKAGYIEDVAEATYNVFLAGVYVLMEIARRLPPPTETWSEVHTRLSKEEKSNGV